MTTMGNQPTSTSIQACIGTVHCNLKRRPQLGHGLSAPQSARSTPQLGHFRSALMIYHHDDLGQATQTRLISLTWYELPSRHHRPRDLDELLHRERFGA